MNPEPIDVTRVALRALRILDDGRRALDDQWRRWTQPDKPSGETTGRPEAAAGDLVSEDAVRRCCG